MSKSNPPHAVEVEPKEVVVEAETVEGFKKLAVAQFGREVKLSLQSLFPKCIEPTSN